jgi:hypothetical protein
MRRSQLTTAAKSFTCAGAQADLFPLKNGSFLGVDVLVPADPAAVLRTTYGNDFMTPKFNDKGVDFVRGQLVLPPWLSRLLASFFQWADGSGGGTTIHDSSVGDDKLTQH